MSTDGNGRIDTAALLAGVNLLDVVQHYGIALKKQGAEYVGRCIWHAPDEHPSMRVIPAKGFVWCPACGQGGDALDFVQQFEGVDFRTACSRLNGEAPNWTAAAPIRDAVAKPAGAWESAQPPPDVNTPDMKLRHLGVPTHIRAIRTLTGDLLGYECRYPRDADGKSASRVWSWGRAGPSDRWHWGCRVMSRPRPLYGLERLGAMPEAPVLLTEGPKKADAGGQLLPRYACVALTGGAGAWKAHDWEPLRGKTVVLWPDADKAGIEAFERLANHLMLGFGCTVRFIDVGDMPHRWDAADAVAEGWDTARVQEWAKGRIRAWTATLPQDEPTPEPTPEPIAESRQDAPQREGEGVAATQVPPKRPVTTAEAVAEAVVKAMAAERAAKAAKRKPKLGVVDGNTVRAPKAAEDGEPLPIPLSDVALGDYWVQTYGSDWRYVTLWGRWYEWKGDTWQEDVVNRVKSLAMSVVRAAAHWPEALSLAPESRRKLSSVAKGGNVLAAAQVDPIVSARVDQWDTDPWLLGVPGGVVDLRSGELLEGRRDDYIRMRCAVAPADPEACEAPEWERFLERVQPDPEVRAYLRRFAGYCLTGLTREHVMAFNYGGGANGKSTFINTLSGIMGDYATVAGMETFAEGLHGHTSEIARLSGKRLVSAEETGSGSRWDEARICSLTGGTQITANFMRMDPFTFQPVLKLMFAGNHMPRLRGVTEGMRRRLNLVPWNVQIPVGERDTSLLDKLQREWPSILRWAIGGCLDYQLQGLGIPPIVDAAGADYLDDEDTVGRWRIAATEDAMGAKVQSSDLYRSYRAWCEHQEEKPLGQRAFVESLSLAGCKRVKSNGVRFIMGIRLRPIEDRVGEAPERSGREWE